MKKEQQKKSELEPVNLATNNLQHKQNVVSVNRKPP